MKVWAFYLKPDKLDKDIPISENYQYDVKYPLYACTSDKSLAKLFRLGRNMNNFLEKRWDIPKDNIDQWFVEHRGANLSFYRLQSYRNKNLNNQTPYFVNVLITDNEVNYTMEVCDSGEILNRVPGWIFSPIFKGKIEDALAHLAYDKSARFALSSKLDVSEDLAEYEYPPDIDILDLNLDFDQFGVFVEIYSNTLSEVFFQLVEIEES